MAASTPFTERSRAWLETSEEEKKQWGDRLEAAKGSYIKDLEQWIDTHKEDYARFQEFQEKHKPLPFAQWYQRARISKKAEIRDLVRVPNENKTYKLEKLPEKNKEELRNFYNTYKQSKRRALKRALRQNGLLWIVARS